MLVSSLRNRFINLKFIRAFYDARTKHDTIFAPLTTIQHRKGSALGVIRVSGTKTSHILDKLTEYAPSVKTLSNIVDTSTHKKLKPRHATLTKIRNPATKELVDIGLVLWFPKPNSYTGEDSCEFHLHGSQAILTSMLSILGSFNGLRPAEAGEFTRRAVLNGKMTLLEAESLPDLTSAKTDQQRRLALKGLSGSTKQKYDSWSESLVNILAHLEASIDFGEDELIGEQDVVANCINKLKHLNCVIKNFIKTSSQQRDLIQNGARLVILGKPNAGKSSFMNLLCRHNKSIVSDMSGTTRDVVEHNLELGGHTITICDTAGLKNTSLIQEKIGILDGDSSTINIVEQHDAIEREGIKKALKTAETADYIIYLVDGAKLSNSTAKDIIVSEIGRLIKMMGDLQAKTIHVVINKIDLNYELRSSLDQQQLEQQFKQIRFNDMPINITINFLSCLSGENFNQITEQLVQCLNKTLLDLHPDNSDRHQVSHHLDYEQDDLVACIDYANERHLSLLKSTQYHLESACNLNINTIDQMAQHVRESLDYLSRIVGSVTNEQVIDVIFRDFCIGK